MRISLDRLAFLIKYVDDKHIDEFKNGEIHFTQLKYFRDKETSGGNKTVGDKNEAHVIRRYTAEQIKKIKIEIKDGYKNILRSYDATGNLGNNRFGHALEFNTTSKDTDAWGINCFTILRFVDPDVFRFQHSFGYSRMENKFYEIYHFKIRKKFIDRLYYEVGGSHRSPIILFTTFLKKLKNFQKSSNLPIFYNPVKYYSDYDNSNVDSKKSWNNQVMQAAFTKSNHYINQKEFRIISFCDVTKIGNNSNINIGSLKGCYMDFNNGERKPDIAITLQVDLSSEFNIGYKSFLETRLILQHTKNSI